MVKLPLYPWICEMTILLFPRLNYGCEMRCLQYKVFQQNIRSHSLYMMGQNILHDIQYAFGKHVLCFPASAVSSSFFFFFFLSAFQHWNVLSVGSVYYSRDSQTSFFIKNFIKNGFHGTIHKFKNYFVTVFSVFNKISII